MAIGQADVQNIHVGPGELILVRGGTTATYAATEEGGVLRVSRAVEYVEADEAVGALEAYITGEECTFEVMSLEQKASLLQEALGHGAITTTAAATSVTGKDELYFGGSSALNECALQYRAPRRHNPNLFVTIELYRVVAQTDIEKRYTKRGRTSYRVHFRALNDMSKPAGERLGKITIETAVPTA